MGERGESPRRMDGAVERSVQDEEEGACDVRRTHFSTSSENRDRIRASGPRSGALPLPVSLRRAVRGDGDDRRYIRRGVLSEI